MENGVPNSRQEWANLEWKEAQVMVGNLLNNSGFMKFEEKRIGLTKRADVLVIKNNPIDVVFGIIEVKCYKKVNPSLVNKSIIQACKYVKILYPLVINNNRWGNKEKKFFVAVVFTNDYPVSLGKIIVNNYLNYLPKELKEGIPIIISTPGQLLKKLAYEKLLPDYESKLDDFF